MNKFQRFYKTVIGSPFAVFSILFFSLVMASALAGFSPGIPDYVILNSYITQVVPSGAFWFAMMIAGLAGTVGVLKTKPTLVGIASMILVLGHSFVFFVLVYSDYISSQAVRSPWIVLYASYIFLYVGMHKSWWRKPCPLED